MARFILACFFCLVVITPAGVSTDSPAGEPDHGTPLDVVKVWLRFHDSELCQGVDAEFEFSGTGVGVRSLVEDERSYQRLEELLEPLRNFYRIELHPERPPQKENPDDGKKKDPPASLWENYELRSFLGDPFARARERDNFEGRLTFKAPPPPDELLKQRLILYAEQTLDWSRKMERYAKDLPALTHVALDRAMSPLLRSQANVICREHVENMDRYIRKLHGNLELAFPPHSDDKEHSDEDPGAVPKTPVDRADMISDYAQTVARRVYQFIYPEHYTVGLEELRQPGLLDSLRMLRKMNAEYKKALAKTK